jgi:hypothetical protein
MVRDEVDLPILQRVVYIRHPMIGLGQTVWPFLFQLCGLLRLLLLALELPGLCSSFRR